MTAAEFQMNLDLMTPQIRLLSALDIRGMIDELNMAETTGAIVDPTLYREYIHSGKGPALKRVLRAILNLQIQAKKAAEADLVEIARAEKTVPKGGA